MVDYFTEEEISLYKKTFNKYENQGKGLVPRDEIQKIMNLLGIFPTEACLEDAINDVAYKHYWINFHQFVEILKKIKFDISQPSDEEKLLDIVRKYDKEKSGVVSLESFRLALIEFGEKITDEEFNEMMDSNLLNEISYEEFIKMMMSK